MKYDTIGFLGFNLKHDTTEPNVLENAKAIRYAIINRLASMTDKEILSEIEFGGTILEINSGRKNNV